MSFQNTKSRGTQIPPSSFLGRLNKREFLYPQSLALKPTFNSRPAKTHNQVANFFEAVISYLLLLRTYLKPV